MTFVMISFDKDSLIGLQEVIQNGSVIIDLSRIKTQKFMKLILTTLILPLLWLQAAAQDEYTLKTISITVTGTSTLHDWEMKTDNGRGQALFTTDGSGPAALKDLSVTIVAETLKSGKDAMDKNAYKSLKTDKHKNITLQIANAVIQKQGNDYVVNAEGKLQIAGTTKPVTIKATGTSDRNGNIRFKGERSLKMSDFGVEPPAFMFGSVKTGDDINVIFDVSFSKTAVETNRK